MTGTPWSQAKKPAVIPASEFHFDPKALTCVCPEQQQLSYRGTHIDAQGDTVAYFEGRLLQCRHCPRKQECMYTPESADHRKGKGRQVSFVVHYAAKRKSKTPYTDWMKERVDSEQGKQIYAHRMSVVEPVFGNLTNNKGLKRFSMRGRRKVQDQWHLYCLVHNIEKLKNYGSLGR